MVMRMRLTWLAYQIICVTVGTFELLLTTMATSESTPMPKEMLVPVSVEEFFKWDDLEQIYLCGLEDSASSDKDTAGKETSHTLDFQQDSPGLFPKLSSMNVVVTPSLHDQ